MKPILSVLVLITLALGLGGCKLSPEEIKGIQTKLEGEIIAKVSATVESKVGEIFDTYAKKLNLPADAAAALKTAIVTEVKAEAEEAAKKMVAPMLEDLAKKATDEKGSKTGTGILSALWGLAQLALGAGFGMPKTGGGSA